MDDALRKTKKDANDYLFAAGEPVPCSVRGVARRKKSIAEVLELLGLG
jgi:hypothetical protein